MPMDEHKRFNQLSWNEAVHIHMDSDGYGLREFLEDRKNKLHQRDIDEMGDVRGQSLLHLQCHFGMDTLSWAMLGATVTGIDFSPPAIEAARGIAAQLGFDDARFIESELFDAPSALDEQFDRVYTGIGALNWLPDIRGWARVVSHFLKPGGVFYIVEGHPMLWAMDDEREDQEMVAKWPYFEREEPLRWDDPADYADPNARLENTVTYEWNHGLGEIVSALIDAGLTIEFVHEHKTLYWRALRWMESVQGANEWRLLDEWRLPEGRGNDVPLMYSIRAHKAAVSGRA